MDKLDLVTRPALRPALGNDPTSKSKGQNSTISDGQSRSTHTPSRALHTLGAKNVADPGRIWTLCTAETGILGLRWGTGASSTGFWPRK